MENSLFYRDYFSIKTLNKFNVNPNTSLDLNSGMDNILSPFGNISNDDKKYLEGKVVAALKDNDMIAHLDRQNIVISELDEEISFDTYQNDDFEKSNVKEIDALDEEKKI